MREIKDEIRGCNLLSESECNSFVDRVSTSAGASADTNCFKNKHRTMEQSREPLASSSSSSSSSSSPPSPPPSSSSALLSHRNAVLDIQNDTGGENDDNITVVPLPKIIVRDPVVHDTWDQGKYTSYQICIRTKHPAFHLQISTVRRRFSELLWLDNLLKSKNQGAALLPSAPPKTFFLDRFSPSFIKRRMKSVQEYLNELQHIEQILSDNAFHLFVQTDLSTQEMMEYFDGKLPDTIIAAAWANMGHVHSHSLLSGKPLSPEPEEIVMNEEDDLVNPQAISPTATTTTATTTEDDRDAGTTCSISSSDSENKITDLGRLGLPVRAEVEMAPPLVLGEAAWRSDSDGSSRSSAGATITPDPVTQS